MHSADDDSSTLLPAAAGIERDAADKAKSAAHAAATRVTAWLQRSPTGPLLRATCDDATSRASADTAAPADTPDTPDTPDTASALIMNADAPRDEGDRPTDDAQDEHVAGTADESDDVEDVEDVEDVADVEAQTEQAPREPNIPAS